MSEKKGMLMLSFPFVFVLFFLFLILLCCTTSNGSHEIFASLSFQSPFSDDVEYRISSKFGTRIAPDGEKKWHSGIDLATPSGTDVRAIGDGIVYSTYHWCADDGYYGNKCGGGFGNYVYLQHELEGVTYYSLYAHLLGNSINLIDGQAVRQGDKIAEVGNSGSSTGAHLHLTIMTPKPEATKKYCVDPMYIVEGIK